MTNAELVALLREARESVIRDIPCFGWKEDEVVAQQDRLELLARIDAALAAHEAEERVEWTPLADGKACAAEVDGYLVEVRPSYAGDGWWAWKAEQPVKHRDRQHGHKRTKELAQEAAIAAARGVK